jgi:hypothetical protein
MATQKRKTARKKTAPKTQAAGKQTKARTKTPTGKGRQEEIQDFVARYDQGPPQEGISDEETLRHHDELAASLAPDEYREVARESFERMDPQERADFGRRLRRRAEEEGVDTREAASDDALEDAGILGSLAGMLQDKKPGALSELLSGNGRGGVGEVLKSPAARAAIGGIAAMAAKRFLR